MRKISDGIYIITIEGIDIKVKRFEYEVGGKWKFYDEDSEEWILIWTRRYVEFSQESLELRFQREIKLNRIIN